MSAGPGTPQAIVDHTRAAALEPSSHEPATSCAATSPTIEAAAPPHHSDLPRRSTS